MTQNNKRPAVFVDRDGTLIEEVNFLSRVEDLQLFAYTPAAISSLKRTGFLVIVVTNQSGIGRKLYGDAELHAIHDQIQDELNGQIDGFYFCPHLPTDGCACRKPNLGMIDAALGDFEIDLENSWIIGDKNLDVETGINAGIRTAMVMTGYGRNHLPTLGRAPDFVGETLLDAANEIVRSMKELKTLN
ncbi:MAG: HAD family hydrolase [Pyrinomonadaceae bacterium]